MVVEKRRQFIINFVYFAIVAVIAFYLFKFTLGYLMPFIFGFFVAFALRPIVTKLASKFGEKPMFRFLAIAVFYLVLGLLVSWVVLASIGFFKNAFTSLESVYNTTILPFALETIDYINAQVDQLNPDVRAILEETLNTFVNWAKNFAGTASSTIISFVTSIVGSLPSLLISILIAIISSIFFTLDYQNIISSTLGVLPARWRTTIMDVKNTFFNTIVKYLIAYGKLITLTFVELSIGFLMFGISNPFGLAFLIAIVDIMPVLGTGTIMIPWFIAEFAMGNASTGFALLGIYVVITIIRNILEPKLVGAQIGLHPLATLMCIYVGMKLFGFLGLFGLPITVVILKTMHDQGKISFFKEIMGERD